jgi:hypothetical protein
LGTLAGGEVVDIQSSVDLLTVTKVQANRGNCKTDIVNLDFRFDLSTAQQEAMQHLPRTLKFGEVLHVLASHCDVREFSFDSDQGSWITRW